MLTIPERAPQAVPPPSLLNRISDASTDHRDYRTVSVNELQMLGYTIEVATTMHVLLVNAAAPVPQANLHLYRNAAISIIENDNERVREELGHHPGDED